MPIYEYTCKSCETKFDKLIRSISNEDSDIPCPKCGSKKTARAFSVFAVGAEQSGKSSSAATGCGRCGGPGPCAMG